MFYFLIIVGSIIDTMGDILMKQWADTNDYKFFTFGFITYMISATFLAISYKYENIVIATVLFILLNMIALLLFNNFYFKETIKTMEYVALGFGLSAIVLFNLADKS